MASNELAIRFTENKYATRLEVSRELKMSLIDNIWSNILSYRSNFNTYLTLKSIDNNALLICFCPTVNGAINALEAKLIRVMGEYIKLSPMTGDLSHFEDTCFIQALKHIADKYQLEATDVELRAIIQGDIKEISPSHRILLRYFDCLNLLKDKFESPLDIDFLASLLTNITGNAELTSFYRNVEDKNPENRVIIDRIYTCAPVGLIEPMMNNLFSFIAHSQTSGLVKALTTYYYLNYIRPFNEYSDEIALLFAKAILAHTGLGKCGVLLPLESLLTENQKEIAQMFIEVQKSYDLTYFLNYAVKQIDKKCDEAFDYFTHQEVIALKKDYYQADETETPKEEKIDDIAINKEEAQDKPVIKPVIKEPEILREPINPEVSLKPKATPVKENTAPQKGPVMEQIAFSYLPPLIDEKQALRLEEHLKELDPSLKNNEARFYARHCTLGKKYTIAQCKKALGCAYETARTSMDHLVSLGYYRKETVKNKNVYTPIKKN